MSDENQGAPEGAAEQKQGQKQQVPAEFLERLNQFIRMANRLERRRDSQYATFVFMNAFARYSAHHYLLRVKDDTPEERASYVDYISRSFADMAMQNIEQISDFQKQVAMHRKAAREQGSTGATDATAPE
jgi:hypothetical protein